MGMFTVSISTACLLHTQTTEHGGGLLSMIS